MAGAVSLLMSGGAAAVVPPPEPAVVALTNHTVVSGGAVENGAVLFRSGSARATVGAGSVDSWAGEWVASGGGDTPGAEFSAMADNRVGSAASLGDAFNQWIDLGAKSSSRWLLQTTGSFRLRIRRKADLVIVATATITVT